MCKTLWKTHCTHRKKRWFSFELTVYWRNACSFSLLNQFSLLPTQLSGHHFETNSPFIFANSTRIHLNSFAIFFCRLLLYICTSFFFIFRDKYLIKKWEKCLSAFILLCKCIRFFFVSFSSVSIELLLSWYLKANTNANVILYYFVWAMQIKIKHWYLMNVYLYEW